MSNQHVYKMHPAICYNLAPETIQCLLSAQTLCQKMLTFQGAVNNTLKKILVRSEQKFELKKPACRYAKKQQTCIRKRKFSSEKRLH